MFIAAIVLTSAWFAHDQNSALIQLAKQTVEAEVAGTAIPTPVTRSEVHPVFVTIEKNGKVLGCRGGLESRTTSLEDEVILAARGAAAHDPKYKPLARTDLSGILVTITIVTGTRPIPSVQGLEPSDGLVLRHGDRIGIVLPWEGKDPNVRLMWAYQKAGVPVGASAELWRLVATRSRG